MSSVSAVICLVALFLRATSTSITCTHGDRKWCKEDLNWTQLAGMLTGNPGSFNNTVCTLAAGHHTMEGGLYYIESINNFTLRGSPDGNTIIQCNSTKLLCRIVFKESENINIHNLTFVYPNRIERLAESASEECYESYNKKDEEKYYKHCEHFKSLLFSDVTYVTITNVQMIGADGNWMIVGPIGTYQIHNVSFTTWMGSLEFDNITEQNESNMKIVFILLSKMRNVSVDCKISNISFFVKKNFHSTAFHIIRQNFRPVNNRTHFINTLIKIENITAINQSVIQFNINSCKGLQVTLAKINASGGWSNQKDQSNNKDWSIIKNLTVMGKTFIRSAIQVYIEDSDHKKCNNMDFNKSSILITGGSFKKYLSSKGSGLLYEVNHSDKEAATGVTVTVRKCYFKKNLGLDYANVIYANEKESFGYNISNLVHQQNVILILQEVQILKNFRGLRIGKCVFGKREDTNSYFYQESYQRVHLSCPGDFPWRGALHLEGFQRHRVSLSNITINNTGGKGISLVNSIVEVAGCNLVNYSVSPYGGGILLMGNSLMLFHNNTTLNISANFAFLIGGGMYIMDNCTFSLNPLDECYCFFQFVHKNGSIMNKAALSDLKVTIHFQNNKARRVINLFNTNIDKCKLETEIDVNRTRLFNHLFHNTTSGDDKVEYSNSVASLPRRIVNCEATDLEIGNLTPISVYKGQNVAIDLMVMADMDIPMESVAHFFFEKPNYTNVSDLLTSIPLIYNTKLDHKCNNVVIPWSSLTQYTNLSNKTEFAFLQINVPLFSLAPIKFHPPSVFLYNFVNISINPTCPPGFIMRNNECQCHPYLTEHSIGCDISTVTLTIPTCHWIGKVHANSTDVHFSTACYPGFCNKSNKSVDLSSDPDGQCMFDRTGVLCSKCPKGMSVVFGSTDSICKLCSTSKIFLFVLVFLLLGPLLVSIMCYFNLTIATRTLNGFLFYTSTVYITSNTLHLSKNVNIGTAILSGNIFFELCLYDGFDQFGLKLLHFLFPLYLILIVASVILLPKYKCLNSQRLHKAIGPRIIPVLATITWISFSHISWAVINSLHFTDLCNTKTQVCHKVWIYDGDLEYFGSLKHIILGIIAIALLICVLIPVAVITLFGDLLRRCISKKMFLNFLDAFQASYRYRYGFWVGVRMMLPILIVLLITMRLFSLLEPHQVEIGIVVILIFILSFQIITNPFRGIQFNRCLPESLKRKMTERLSEKIANLLDMSFLLNMIALFSFIATGESEYVETMLVLSRVIAYCEFLLILIYHFLEYTYLGASLIEKLPCMVVRIKRFLKFKSARSNEDEIGSTSASTSRVNTVYLELKRNKEEDSTCSKSEGGNSNDVRSEDPGNEDFFNRANHLRVPLLSSPSASLQ